MKEKEKDVVLALNHQMSSYIQVGWLASVLQLKESYIKLLSSFTLFPLHLDLPNQGLKGN